jgi:dihydrolipoamide dehydrogenase
VAAGMSNGIQFLMKKNKIDVIKGSANLKKGQKVAVTEGEDKRLLNHEARHIYYSYWCSFKRITKLATRR